VEITGKTNIYGIIGCPVKHSLSPVFQAYFAQQYGLDVVYVPYHVEEKQLKRAIDGLAALGVQGINVTVPYKEAVLSYVQADEDVQCIGAANTLKLVDGVWQASNTDWQGVAAVLIGSGLSLKGGHVLLFGAGGTARAVLHAAYKQGVENIAICNRSPERVTRLIEHAKHHYPNMNCYAIAWHQDDVSAMCNKSPMVINTTSIGLDDSDIFPFHISGEGWLMDAVYKPVGQTACTRAANASQRCVTDGLPMLVAQGAKSFANWHPQHTPDILDVLVWMERKLTRHKTVFPGWENRK